MKTIDSSFDGLVTDYALGEIEDLEVVTLIEALMEKDDESRATVEEIRAAAALATEAGADPLLAMPQRTVGRWPILIPAAMAGTAAVFLVFLSFPDQRRDDEKPGPIAAGPPLAAEIATADDDREKTTKLWSARRDLSNRRASSRRGGMIRWLSFSKPPEWIP